jgi:DNA polymerase I-like protein with 3'-5' exonuclease and polymerase domains
VSVAGNVLIYLGGTDASYTKFIQRSYSRFSQVFLWGEQIHGWGHCKMLMQTKNCKLLATTRFSDIKSWSLKELKGSKEDNIGYHFERDGIKVVLLPDIKRALTQRDGSFIIDRYLQKLSSPEKFIVADPFTYSDLDGSNLEKWLGVAAKAFACAIDIETSKDGLVITSVSYTFGLLRNGNIRTKTCVVKVTPHTYREAFACIRQLNRTEVPKILQNGRYDATYFLRFAAPIKSWFFDTYHMQHCMYAELDKNLGYLASFYLLNFHYWKEEAGVDLYQYNAKDTHNTFWIFMAQMLHSRERGVNYSIHNYLKEFKLVLPCLHCGQEGILVDDEVRKTEREAELQRKETAALRLGKLTGLPGINPNSPKQMLALLNGLGFKCEATDAKTLQSFAEASPLNERIHDLITDYRESNKAISTYYDVELLGQRLLYEIDPAATDSGRLGSKASNYWCGTQIQNIPPYFKGCLVADPGWELFEVDKSQSESWCTGYLSQDANLMQTLHTSPDFHCTNASLFFGIPFNELYQIAYLDEDGTDHPAKVLRKDIRTVAKRVNHGANYNMGWFVLWQTMGTKAVLDAKNLLQLPMYYGIKQVCEYLLNCFKTAYPRVKGEWYKEVIQEVKITGKLVGPTGWTRRTFLKPWETKPDLNAVVAHHPQSLSVMLVNESFYRVWKELQLRKYPGKLRLKAQIHDSLFGQYKIGHEYIVKEIEAMMAVPCKIHGRTMVIPSDSKWGATSWAGLKD